MKFLKKETPGVQQQAASSHSGGMSYEDAIAQTVKGDASEEALETLRYIDGTRPFRGGEITSADPLKEREFMDVMNQDWAIICHGGSANILGFVEDAAADEPAFNLYSQQAFMTVTANYPRVFHKNRLMKAGEYWLSHPRRREYRGIRFDPDYKGSEHYNLFRGFPIGPTEGDCSLFLVFVRDVICVGNGEVTEYVLNWLAHLFQKPTEKPETALVLRGRQGTGKTSFAGIVGRLLGRYYVEEADMDRIIGRFNVSMADKLLVLADEALWGGERSKVGALKSFITQKRITIEKKGIDPITMSHYARLIIASNESWAVHADRDDRRFVFLDVSAAKARDTNYFDALFQQMEKGGYEALMYHLLDRDIAKWSPRQRPDSGFGQDVIEMSMTAEQAFWFEVLSYGEIPIRTSMEMGLVDHTSQDWEQVPKRLVYDAYIEHCRKQGQRALGQSGFWNALYGMLGVSGDEQKEFTGSRIQYDGERHRTVRLLPLASLRRMYAAASGCPIEWEDMDTPDVPDIK